MSAPDLNPSQGFKATDDQLANWTLEDDYWRNNWRGKSYVIADRGYDYYQPAYRYGYESATHHRGKAWSDVETDLREGWDRVDSRGTATWERVKDAVRDAWNRATR